MRCVLLNAMPLNAVPFEAFTLSVRRVSATELKQLVQLCSELQNFVRHEATARLLSSLLSVNLTPSAGLYRYQDGDRLIVVSLKAPARGQEVASLSVSDLEIYVVDVSASAKTPQQRTVTVP